jgi:UDP-N-acetylmuramoylalanine--D-glutamate ligase
MTCKYDGTRALILGAGVSGEAAALLLLARGSRVTLVDARAENNLSPAAARIRLAGGEVAFDVCELPQGAFDLCVVSPGFARNHPWLAVCQSRGLPMISELELGFCYWPGKVLAVTGSKGKSSVVKFCADTLTLAGFPASPAGNYGIPLSQLALERPDLMWAVTEVSSFQMEHTVTFKPEIAILLNVQDDHLDRHADMSEYKGLKLKLFANMDERGYALLPAGLDEEGRVPEGVPSRRFGADAGCDWAYAEHAVHGFRDGHRVRVSVENAWFDNEILGLAAAASSAALLHAGLTLVQVEQGFKAFVPLAHRLQRVAVSKGGVTFVDDSKATSLAATAAALRMVAKPVRLIAGGLLKEKDLETIKELLTQTTKKVYLIGRCAGQMYRAWSPVVPCEECGTLECAVDAAFRDASAGETVLLSPGTASFDQFTSYRERGERFISRVRAVADL